jgi:cell division protein FtsL
LIKNKKKKKIRKKVFSLKAGLNFDASQRSISKGKFLGSYMLVIGIVFTGIFMILAQYAVHCKFNYDISRMQEQKIKLNNEYKLVSLQLEELTSKERIIELAKKQGLEKPVKNVVMLFK